MLVAAALGQLVQGQGRLAQRVHRLVSLQLLQSSWACTVHMALYPEEGGEEVT